MAKASRNEMQAFFIQGRPVVRRVQTPAPAGVPSAVWRMWRSSAKNAINRHIPWKLTDSDVARLWKRCGERCEVTGIPFDLEKSTQYRRRPWFPSLDRVDSTQPYSFQNVRLVCVAVNVAMNEWGLDVLLKISQAIVTQHRHDPGFGKRGWRPAPIPLLRLGYTTVEAYLNDVAVDADQAFKTWVSRSAREIARDWHADVEVLEVPTGKYRASGDEVIQATTFYPAEVVQQAFEHVQRRREARS